MKKIMNDKELSMFTEMIINSLNEIKENCNKPWITKEYLSKNQNIDGRVYRGMNQFFLTLFRYYKKYKYPVWGTFKSLEAKKLCVRKGESASVVSLFSRLAKNEEGEKLSYDKYLKLSEDKKKEYDLIPYYKGYYVFNIDQTNVKNIKLYNTIVSKYSQDQENDTYNIDSVDSMLTEGSWICPINQLYQDKAYYSPTENAIVMPLREQFRSDEMFYSILFHEMAHSTAKELNREIIGKFGDHEYGKEELIAELTSLMVCTSLEIEKVTKSNSIAYIRLWLQSIDENNSFLSEILYNVNRAYKLIIKNISKRIEINEAV